MDGSQRETVMVLGGSGHMGERVLRELKKANKFNIVAFQREDSEKDEVVEQITLVQGDIDNHESLVKALKGVDIIISCLNGGGIESQHKFIPAAKEAGVRRFYPSEYGHRIVYTSADHPKGYLHEEWKAKDRVQDTLKKSGLEWTVVEGGDFYNQDWEPVFCPWTKTDVNEYHLKIYGTGDKKITWTNMDDNAAFIVATISSPLSKNAQLNYQSDEKTFLEVADLLEKYSGKRVHREFVPEEQIRNIIAHPEEAAPEEKESSFPVDFWHIVKWGQATGRFHRDKDDLANDKFPEIRPTTFADYFKKRFNKEH